MKRVFALILLYCIAGSANAEPFGWYAYAFHHEGLSQLFNSANEPQVVNPLIDHALSCFEDQRGDEAVELAVSLREMLSNGWVTTSSKATNANHWSAFAALADCPAIVPELSFSSQHGRFDPAMFANILAGSADAQQSVLRHFSGFGRALGATQSYSRCADVYSVVDSPTQENCSPLYFMLSPPEVEQLALALEAAIPKLEAKVREAYKDLAMLVLQASSKRQALFFVAFN